jgi:phosphatidate phosphatase APP1
MNLRVVIDAPQDIAVSDEWLQFHGVTGPGELLHRFRGEALIVPPQGVSIISDIDDTIKRTQVRDRREMLLNTFARRFEAAPGMAAYYRALAQAPDTRFHYLSASPIQLYPPWRISFATRLSRGQHAPAREHHVAHADSGRPRIRARTSCA